MWDKTWHFTGAAEYNAKGLDRTWFQGDAAHSKVDSRMSAIYAASFKKTGTSFPLIWAPAVKWVNAVNVTSRYTPDSLKNAPARLMIRVWNSRRTERVAADVSVSLAESSEDEPRTGKSRDEGFAPNDILAFDIKPNESYKVSVAKAEARVTQSISTGKRKQIIVDVVLPGVSGS